MLEIKKLSKRYKNFYALNEFSLKIKKGEIVGLIGKNGAGKTTLLNCISGNIFPTQGEITYNKQDILKNKDIISKFGILIETSFLDYMTAVENLRLLMYASGHRNKSFINQKIDEILEIVGLKGKENYYVKNYSFGMKQRLGLAQALLNGEELFILDEPLVGLDVLGRELVKDIIRDKAKKENKIVLFSDHNLNEVKDVCDRIIYIDSGEKKYDGVFNDEKEYQIIIEKVTPKVQDILTKTQRYNIIDKNKIVIKSIEDVNEVLNILVQNKVYIKDIKTIESSLMRFFEGEK